MTYALQGLVGIDKTDLRYLRLRPIDIWDSYNKSQLKFLFLNFTQFVIEQCDLPTKSNQGVLDIACQRDWLTFKNIAGSIKSDKNLVNYTEIGWSKCSRFRECCREAGAEVINNSSNEIHQT